MAAAKTEMNSLCHLYVLKLKEKGSSTAVPEIHRSHPDQPEILNLGPGHQITCGVVTHICYINNFNACSNISDVAIMVCYFTH